jgi:hypothetical protein
MVLNTTFNNISFIFVVVSFIGGGNRKNHRPVASHRQTLSHNVVSSTPRHERDSNSQQGSCKSNNHTITITMALQYMIQYWMIVVERPVGSISAIFMIDDRMIVGFTLSLTQIIIRAFSISEDIDKHWLNIEQTYFISTEYVPLSPRYNWHIVKSGVKHHNSKPVPSRSVDLYDDYQISIFKNLLR